MRTYSTFLRGRLAVGLVSRGPTTFAGPARLLFNMHTCADDASTASAWAAPRIKRPHKRFLKRNPPHVGMVQFMNALADKVHKQKVHAQINANMHSITRPCAHYSTTIPMYISSSGTPVGIKFTATTYMYVEIKLLNNVAMLWSTYLYVCMDFLLVYFVSYINSSKFSTNWRATATYVGMVVE